MRPQACVAALAVAVHGYLPPLPHTNIRTRRRATVQDEPQQTRKEFTVPKAASTRETEVRAVTALSRDGNVSLPEVFVGNDGSSRQLYDNGVVMPVGWTGASTRRRTGSKFTGTLLASTEFPVGDAGANPQRIAPFSRKTWLQGVRDDIRKRSPLYAQDWFDGLRNPAKSAGACLFLYFAVLAPAVAFGGVMQTATCGALGPRDVLLSCGLSGMAYAYGAVSFCLFDGVERSDSRCTSRETQRGAARRWRPLHAIKQSRRWRRERPMESERHTHRKRHEKTNAGASRASP